jgi:hypothetical protein
MLITQAGREDAESMSRPTSSSLDDGSLRVRGVGHGSAAPLSIDPVYLDASYYVMPDGAVEKPYTLLYEALRRASYAALAQWIVHNREHLVLLHQVSQHLSPEPAHTGRYQDPRRGIEGRRRSPGIPSGAGHSGRTASAAYRAGFGLLVVQSAVSNLYGQHTETGIIEVYWPTNAGFL